MEEGSWKMEAGRWKKSVLAAALHVFLLFLLVAFVAEVQTSCRNAEKQEKLVQLDSLNQSLKQLDGLIGSLEENDFQQRRDSIRLKLKVLHDSSKDSSSPDLKGAVITYAAIASNYDHFLNEEPVVAYETSKHHRAYEELKTRAGSRHTEDEEFRNLLVSERQGVKMLYEKAADLGYRTISVEKDYERASAVINPVFHSLEK